MAVQKKGLALDQRAWYEIRVQGRLEESWSEYIGDLKIRTGRTQPPVTVLTGMVMDQAALQGLLSSLYSLGLPLLLVRCLKAD
ncbi:MAG: hypothetical protein JSV89_15710 [Spirochaetaceae bacterium]|nr:MAG: hypothetical protein JSV89_15710 [Spirochaetaceae bacterium]